MARALLIALAAAALTTAALWLWTGPELAAQRRQAEEFGAELAPLAAADSKAAAFHSTRRELEVRIEIAGELQRHRDDLTASWAAIDPLLDDRVIFLTLTPQTAEISISSDEQAATALGHRLSALPELAKVEVQTLAGSGKSPEFAVRAQRTPLPDRQANEVESL